MSARRYLQAGATGLLVCCALAVPWHAASAQAGVLDPDPAFASQCGSLENAYGPFDYTNPTDVAERLPIVESYHFNSSVEQLVAGMTAELPGGDLDYTLRAFPNHHRALYAMMKYTLQHQGKRVPPGAHYPGECYMVRAMSFRPEDASVRLIYGIYLTKVGRTDEALAQYETAAELAPGNAEVHYNLGLVYHQLHRSEEALEHAKIAYRLGYPLQGLKNQLKEDGLWPPREEVESRAESRPPPPRGGDSQ